MRILNLVAICVLGGLSLLPLPARAEPAEPPQIVAVRVGLADRYKAGLWTQVEVTLRGGSQALVGELSVIVPDGDGVPGRASTPCRLAPGEEITVPLLSRFGRVRSTLAAELCAGADVLASRTFESAPQADGEHFLPAIEFQKLIVTIGDAALGIEEVGKLAGAAPEHRPIEAHVDDVARLPTHWCGYEGVDAVILSTSRPETYRRLAADSARVKALNQWVNMGGRLVFCVGSQADEVLAAKSPLGQFAPGRLEKIVPLRQTGALESYCESRSVLPPAGAAATPFRVPRLTDVQGMVEAREADLPLVIRTAQGFGQVVFFPFNLDRPPLAEWVDRPLLLAHLLDMPTRHVEESDDSAAMMHHGYNDLSGQLRSALDQFPGVWLVPFWLVAGLIVLYLLLIGPGDYFFLRKLVGRMEWTWLTFPVLVLLVCLGAYALACRLKGDEIKVNQADLVDVDVASGRLRGATWLNVFSPRTESFNLSVRPRRPKFEDAGQDASPALPSEARAWFAWLGLPGGALGGMNPRTAGPLVWTDQFRYAPDLDALMDVPIQLWSTKSLTARWEARGVAGLPADLVDNEQVLSGTITNTLACPLRNCILAHGQLVYDLGTIEPGQSARVGAMVRRSELRTLLTGRKVVSSEGSERYEQVVTPYDQSSTELPYILRMMMFYGAAGGHRYTGLWNAYQGFADLSDLLKADRVILVGQGPDTPGDDRHGAELLRDGRPLAGPHDQHVTIYRFVFPVKKEKAP